MKLNSVFEIQHQFITPATVKSNAATQERDAPSASILKGRLAVLQSRSQLKVLGLCWQYAGMFHDKLNGLKDFRIGEMMAVKLVGVVHDYQLKIVSQRFQTTLCPVQMADKREERRPRSIQRRTTTRE